jgi:hypothetical protein
MVSGSGRERKSHIETDMFLRYFLGEFFPGTGDLRDIGIGKGKT